jgi:energy-converting hydrogenase Eha subunit B
MNQAYLWLLTKKGEPVLALSGSLFSLSFFVAYLYGNYITAGANFLLAATSIAYHLFSTPTTFLIDQVALYTVVTRSFVDGYNGGLYGLVITVVINTYNYIVYFSPYSKYLEYHPNKTIGNFFHATIHLFAVLGVIAQQYYINEGQ